MTIKENMLKKIKSDILEKRSDLPKAKVNLLAEYIYEISLLRNIEGVEGEDIMIYSILRRAILKYDNNIDLIDNHPDFDLRFLHDMIVKYSGGL